MSAIILAIDDLFEMTCNPKHPRTLGEFDFIDPHQHHVGGLMIQRRGIHFCSFGAAPVQARR
jgi:hypothetical protein